MSRLPILTAFLLWSTAVLAADATGTAGAANVAIVDDAVCRWLGVHVPDAEVAYDPARDAARGVASADLPGTPALGLAGGYEMPIRVLLPLAGARGRGYGELHVGLVRLEADGSVTFDGQPIDQPTAALLRASCSGRPGY